MSIIHTLSAYLPGSDTRPISQIDQEIVDEIDFHIAMKMEENMSQGMSPEAARAAAFVQFGDITAVRQKCRRVQLGARIMWQRIQMALSAVLLAAVVFLAFELYNSQRANQAAIDDIASTIKQMTPAAGGGSAQAAGDKQPGKAEAATPADPMKPYPITIKADSVREFATLAVNFGKLKLNSKAITVVPISTDAGVTGAVLIGNGTYDYAPADGKEFSGHFRAAMLRFNPRDADAIIKLSEGKSVTDKGAAELAKAVLGLTFRHCYHAGQDALIPAEHAIAADVISQEVGDVLMSSDDKTDVVYDFTGKKKLYPEE